MPNALLSPGPLGIVECEKAVGGLTGTVSFAETSAEVANLEILASCTSFKNKACTSSTESRM